MALVAGVVAAGALILAYFALGLPVWASLVAAGALFAGVYLIGDHWADIMLGRQAERMDPAEMRRRIRAGLGDAARIRDAAVDIPDARVQHKIIHVCDLAERMFNSFALENKNKARTARFVLYLEQFLPLIERYTKLSAMPEGRELLLKSSGDAEFWELLHQAETEFEQGLTAYLADDAVEMRNMGRTLRKMMTVREINEDRGP
jgi:hypothetical protein